MPTLSTLALYVLTAAIVLVVPGPAVLYVVSQGVRHGSRAGITAVLGIHVGTLAQLAAAIVGLSWLLVASSSAFTVIRYLGAAYLVHLGVRALLGRERAGIADVGGPRTARRLFGEGVLVNLLNPKIALFFLAFLPQFVDPGRGTVAWQMMVFGLVFVLLGLCTDAGYALLAGAVGPWLRRSSRLLRGERYVVGCTFIGLGAVAALTPGRQPH
jgi:threonine/homoserine/homoserine lactone efflux protein